MDELLEQFLIEGRDLVADAQAQIAILLEDPADARAIDAAFRAAHTLKGSVGIFAMAPAERALHAAEEVLERRRKTHAALDPQEIARIVAILDQVDRWIDEMERDGALAASATAIADTLVDEGEIVAAELVSPASAPAMPEWAAAVIAREDRAIRQAEGGLTAFRYTPDRDAFFRGDDPLALVAAVPALAALAILPVGADWPAAATIDPFACGMIVEGLSGASRGELQALFRLVPDQIAFHAIDARASAIVDAVPQATSIVRVEAARIDRLADGVGALAVAANAFAPIAERVEALDGEVALAIRTAQAELARAVGSLHRAVSAVRLVPLGPSLRRLPRLVREIAADLGKPIEFTLRGEQAEVDKQIADGLFEPLLHLVRNAIDHGIEPAEQRREAGKPPHGQLSLEIGRDGDDMVVTLEDDGAGIDPDRIRATARSRGLIDADAAAALSDAAALALIFAPGFSTAAQVSGVSGRGVGMDAVQAAVDRMRGRIETDSRIGQGTRFTLRLPANALTTRLLVIEIGPDRYAVPFDQIQETVRVDADRLIPLGTGTACVIRDRTLPVLSLAELLGGTESARLPANLLVMRATADPVALRVDRFSERTDAMVRPPAGLLKGVPSVAGTALTGDGNVLLVLNVAELIG